ncbi:MAG: replicative DNA helicase [Acidimicrobiales bacterium]|jgi:replicative DNA helicase
MVQAFDESRPRPLRPAHSGAKVPPHNLEAEESLLGAMMLSSDAASIAMEICSATDFYKPAHGYIFSAIHSLFERGEPVDAVTVADELRRSSLIDSVGDPAVLVSLQANTPSIANAKHYAIIVEEHALLRRLVGVAGEIAELGYSVPENVAQAVDQAEQMVFDVSERRTTDTIAALKDLLGPGLDRIEELSHRGDAITGVATGFTDLDRILAGLQPSSLTIVGARPAMGKTSFALGVLSHVGAELRRPALLFSLEMGHLELTQRLLASEGKVDAQQLRTGQIKESDWAKLGMSVSRLSEAPIFIDDNPNLTVMDIRARARRLKKAQGDLALVVVDYLQLMTGRARAENRQVEVAEISRGLKILARELQVPVVALSQLSRSLEARQDKRPMLSDLRESGCLVASTKLALVGTRQQVTIGELLEKGARDVTVWAVDEGCRLVKATMTHVFKTGIKPVYRLKLRSGLEVRATANHKFRTRDGWARLDGLDVGDVLAARPRVEVGIGHDIFGTEPVAWDTVAEISPAGEEPVFDATVLDHHSFVANGIVVHNSLEQDADVVLFLYREGQYDADVPIDRRDDAEVIVAKHRNGPTGSAHLLFLGQYARFENMKRI